MNQSVQDKCVWAGCWVGRHVHGPDAVYVIIAASAWAPTQRGLRQLVIVHLKMETLESMHIYTRTPPPPYSQSECYCCTCSAVVGCMSYVDTHPPTHPTYIQHELCAAHSGLSVSTTNGQLHQLGCK